MAAAYTKEFLISAYLSRYISVCTEKELNTLKENADKHFDKVGKDKFRQHASLDAAAIKEYKNASK